MNTSKAQKKMHLLLRLLIEIFTARAGFHIQQKQNAQE